MKGGSLIGAAIVLVLAILGASLVVALLDALNAAGRPLTPGGR